MNRLAIAPVPSRHKTGVRILIALLCGLVAFALVTQTRQRDTEALSSLSQSELIRILDELIARENDLVAERDALTAELASLESGATAQQAAAKAAEERIRTLSIRAGIIPVQGPGITLVIHDPDQRLKARHFVSLVEELRNAGAEAIEVDGVRIGVDSWFRDDPLVLDGTKLVPSHAVLAIGNPGTLAVALGMPGGVLASFRTEGAVPTVTESELVKIRSTREPRELEHATVIEEPEPRAGADS